MNQIDKLIHLQKNSNRYSFYLSFFRVFICLLLIKKLFLQWNLISLLYTDESFLIPTNRIVTEFFIRVDLSFIRSNIYIFISLYLLILILFLFGIGKNLTAVLLFFFYDILQKLCPQILNGGDNFLRFILLYYCFANSFDYFSVSQYKYSKFSSVRNFFSNLSGLSICIHLCLIYFISAIHKIHADVWFNGVATYYTFNIERFNGTPYNSTISKNIFFTGVSTYGTWLIELFYPVLVWMENTKYLVITLAIFLHIGISIFMMLYDFQLLFVVVQGFFVNNKLWVSFYNKKYKFKMPFQHV